MAIEWGAYDTGDTNRGARVGIDAIWSAVSNTSTTVTVTWKFYVQNRYTWNNDQQELRYTGDYTGGSSTSYNNPGQEDGEINYVASRTFTYTYGGTSYGSSPGSLDVTAKLYNMYNGASPSHKRVVAIPARPYGAPAAPTSCTGHRSSDVQHSITWGRVVSASKPWTACWVERYVYNYTTWARVATLGSTTGWTDTGTVANRKYAWRVQSDNSVATSGYSQSAALFTTPAVPTAPTRTDGVGGSQSVKCTNSVGYTEYATEVWRAVDGVYALLTTIPATAMAASPTFIDTTASAARKNKYKFRNKTTSGTVLYSAYSAETTETTGIPTAPAAPTELKPATGTIDPTGPVVFSWKHNPTDGSVQTFYEVQYRHVGSSSWLTSGKTASPLSTWKMPANSVAKDNQVEWQVRTWGYSSTLAGAWSASAKWTTTPLVPLKYPLFLDVDSGRTEANSAVKLITEQTRRVATVSRTTTIATSTAAFNVLSYTLPASLARTGKKFRIYAEAPLTPDTAGMYTDLRIQIGSAAVTGGTILAASYTDHRIVNRAVGGFVMCEYVFDPASAGGENISTINIILVCVPGGGGTSISAGTTRPAFLIIDEIIEGASTAGGGGSGVPPGGTDGQVLTKQSSTDGDAKWEDSSGGALTAPVEYVTLRANANQTMATSAETPITYAAAASDDPFGLWDGGSIVTVKSAGLYEITYSYGYASTAAAGNRITLIRINGGTYRQWYHSLVSGIAVMGTVTFEVKLNAGDTIQVRQYQSSGANLDTTGTPVAYAPALFVSKTAVVGSAITTYGERNYAISRGHAALTSIPHATATNVPFDTAVYEDGITWDGSGFVVPVAGYYDVEALVSYTNSNMTGVRSALLYLNNLQQQSVAGTPISGQPSTTVVAATMKCAAGDIIYVKAYQTSGVAVTTSGNPNYTKVTIAKVPSPALNGSAASGVWGTAPLNIYGADSLVGREIYIDSKGQLRTKPETPAPRTLRRKSASQALTLASTWYTVTFDVDEANGTGVTYAADGTFTVPTAGVYQINAQTLFGGVAAGATTRTRIIAAGSSIGEAASRAENSAVTISHSYRLAAGETVYIESWCSVVGANVTGSSVKYTTVDITRIAA